MSFNLFAAPTKDDIKVGYVDPTLGYVDGVSICEANNYAKNNPGTTFVFRDGDNNVRYLNINEVNVLTPNDLIAKDNECGGIQEYRECGPPRIQFFGGGGIGAVGNPVIGRDGSLLAVDVISGGHGYQYPPIVSAKDDCQFGNGAVLTAVLGETIDEIEVFDGEEDFEEYELCEDTDVGYGFRYGPNGEVLGPWEPQTYAGVGADPIQREIEIFQEALKNPFWTTRESQPDRVYTIEKSYATQDTTAVTFPEWGEFMNQYAVSPVKPSNSVGSDEAGKIFSMEWELNFPISGEYIFRGVCDDVAKVFVDDSLIGDLKGFRDNPSPLQKTIAEGNHIVKVDLLNDPSTKKTTAATTTSATSSNLKAKFIKQGASFYLQVDGSGSGEINFIMDVDDRSFIAGLAAKEVIIPSDGGKVHFKRTVPSFGISGSNLGFLSESGIPQKETIKEKGKFSAGKKYGPIQIIGAGPGAKGPIINIPTRLGIRDADGDDENVKITIADINGEISTKVISNSVEVGEIISSKSWNQNPMGVSMTIEAPLPSVPQEQPPIQIGQCPPNPIWTTRFPGSNQKWYPVRFPSWSKFMNRYAISPVLPLDTPGSDVSGSTFSNSWEIDLPYAGFYGVKGTKDNNGRILIDGKEISSLDTFTADNPKITKVYLTKGRHTITTEVSNQAVEIQSVIDTKIFSTQDWRSPSVPSTSKTSNLKAKFIKQGASFYLQVDGSGSGEINFIMDVDDRSFIAGLAAKEVIIPSDGGRVKLSRTVPSFGISGSNLGFLSESGIPQKETIKEKGIFTGGKKYGPIQIIGAGPGAKGPIINIPTRLGIRDADGDDENVKITIADIKEKSTTTKISQSPTKNGVIYEGPTLFGYNEKRWSKYMNDYSVSPKVFTSISEPEPPVVGKYTLTWKNVNFPETGIYKFNFQADNNAVLKVGGREIFKTSDFSGEKVQYTFNATPGKYDIVIELENVRSASQTNGRKDTVFSANPMGVALYISKDIIFDDSNKTSWTTNPMGVSAILIPPPCAKKIGGRGVVDKVIVEDGGNGYLPPVDQGPGYPVTLILDAVIVENSGINYRCGEDEIKIFPDNGAKFSYTCDSFGKIKEVKVQIPGDPITVYPTISIVPPPGAPPTGVNASFRPVFRVVRDPILPPEQRDRIIQVTDLVGLKQTGYVDGRAYYGAVYYDAGIPYAGYYKTAGPQTRVYATLQESITTRVTTPASAIQRSGTDITSNDPRLNIPGTIQDTE